MNEQKVTRWYMIKDISFFNMYEGDKVNLESLDYPCLVIYHNGDIVILQNKDMIQIEQERHKLTAPISE